MQPTERLLAEAAAVVDTNPSRAIALALIVLADGLVARPRQDLAAHEVCEAVEEFFSSPSDANHSTLLATWHEWRSTVS
jgi:hypothetical protein